MRAVAAWGHLMSSAVTIAARSTMNAYGEASYGTAQTYRAHLSKKRQVVRNAMGDEVVSNQAVYLAGAPLVEPTARITLSTSDVGSTAEDAVHPPIVAVEPRFDGKGPHHTVVYLG